MQEAEQWHYGWKLIGGLGHLEYPDAVWQALAPMLRRQHFEGLAFSRSGGNLPADLHNDFKVRWQFIWLRNQQLRAELQWLAAKAQGAGLKLTVLKGAALLGDVYPDFGARFMSDVDILVKQDDFPKLKEILAERGFRVLGEVRWKANGFKCNFSRWDRDLELVIETHTRLFFQEGDKGEWQTEPLPDLAPLQRLQATDFLLHLCGHAAYQHTFMDLYWFADVQHFLRARGDQVQWTRLFERAQETGLQRSVQAVLWAWQEYLAQTDPRIALPPDVAGKIKRQKIWAKLLTPAFLWRSEGHRVRYYLLKHLLKDSLWQALEYDLLWAWSRLLPSRHELN